MRLKWEKIPKLIYWFITFLKFLYLILFSLFLYFEMQERLKYGLLQNDLRYNQSDLMNQSMVQRLCEKEPVEVHLAYKISLFSFWLIFFIYELIQGIHEGREYIFSIKNWLELLNEANFLIIFVFISSS